MANSDKNIVITPNIGSTTGDPKIVFSGAGATSGPQNITLSVYPTNSGTLSFDGSAGQLFNITNSLSGTIFSVNDVSGIPSIEVLDTGLVKVAEYSGNVLLGTSTDNGTNKLQVAGNISSSGTITATTFSGSLTGNASTATTLATARNIGGVSFNGSANIDLPGVNLAGTQNTSGSAATLTTGRTIALTGDVTYTSGAFNGSANVTGAATLASVGTAGTYTKVTTDAKGRVTSGTTLADTDIPNLNASKITAGTIDAARLPSYVDDVIEGANLAAFPATGETGKIYVALDTNKTYRWSGSAYIFITSGAVDSVAGKTGVVTLVKADVGLGSVDNTADSAKNVATAATLTTARTIGLAGDVTGSVSFNGSANVSITAAVVDDSHAHSFNNLLNKASGTGTYTTSGDYRAPIFYDSDNTAFYVDPATTSTSANFAGNVTFPNTINAGIRNAAADAYVWVDDAYGNFYAKNASGGFYGDFTGYNFRSVGSVVWATIGDTFLQHNTQLRSPIYYDSNNTGYYVDTNSITNLNLIQADTYRQNASGVPRVNLGDPTITEMALFDSEFNNKTEFFPPANVICETSTDGITWSAYSVTDAQKKLLVGGDSGASIEIPNGTAYFRVRFVNKGDYVYLNALYAYHTSGGHSTKVQMYRKSFGSTTWIQHTSSTASVGGWPGHIYLPFSTIGYHPSSQHDEVAVVFVPTWNASWPAQNITLHQMQIWGGYPAGKRNIYSTDSDRNVAFPTILTAATDVRAPIFYDSANTAYYVDPASTSVLATMRATTTEHVAGDGNGMRFWLNDDYKIYMSATSNATWGGRASGETTSDYNMYFRMSGGTNRGFVFRNGTTNVAGIDATGRIFTGGGRIYLNDATTNFIIAQADVSSALYLEARGGGFRVRNAASGDSWFTALDGTCTATTDFRAPIFYDSANTAYYVDPASTSNLLGLTVANTITGSVSGTASNVTGTVAANKGGTGLTSPGASGNVLTSNGSAWVSQLPSAGGITYTTVKTSNYTAAANDGVQTNTSGGAFTVTLPATPAVGAQVIVTDNGGSWATNNLTVGRNGSTIEGVAEDLVCNISRVSVQFVYSGTTWDVFVQAGGAGASVISVGGGGTGVSTLTANNVLLGNGTDSVQVVAPSTTGNVLTSNGTTWTSSAPVLKGYHLISSAVANGNTNVDFTGLNSDYAEYMLIVSGLYGPTIAGLQFLTSSNNGVSFDTAANSYKTNAIVSNNSGTLTSSSTSTTSIGLGTVVSSDYGMYLCIKMVNAGVSRPFSIESTLTKYISTGYQDRMTAFRSSMTAVNAIRLTAGANNLFGTFRLYGIKTT